MPTQIEISLRNYSWNSILRGGQFDKNVTVKNNIYTLTNITFVGGGDFRPPYNARGKFIFKDCSFYVNRTENQLANFTLSRLNNSHVIIDDCQFGRLNASDVTRLHLRNMDNLKAKLLKVDNFKSDNSTYNQFAAVYTKIKSPLKFGQTLSSLLLESCELLENFSISSKTLSSININGTYSNKKLSIYNCDIQGSIGVKDSQLKNLSISNVKCEDTVLGNCKIQSLKIYNSKSALSILNCMLDNASIKKAKGTVIELRENQVDESIEFEKNGFDDTILNDENLSAYSFNNNSGTLTINSPTKIPFRLNLRSDRFKSIIINEFDYPNESFLLCTPSKANLTQKELKLKKLGIEGEDLSSVKIFESLLGELIVLSKQITEQEYQKNQIDSLYLSVDNSSSVTINNCTSNRIEIEQSETSSIKLVLGEIHEISLKKVKIGSFSVDDTKSNSIEIESSQINALDIDVQTSKLDKFQALNSTIKYSNINHPGITEIVLDNYSTTRSTFNVAESETLNILNQEKGNCNQLSIGEHIPIKKHIHFVKLPKDSVHIDRCSFDRLIIEQGTLDTGNQLNIKLNECNIDTLALLELEILIFEIYKGNYRNLIVSNQPKITIEENPKTTELIFQDCQVSNARLYVNQYSISLSSVDFGHWSLNNSILSYFGLDNSDIDKKSLDDSSILKINNGAIKDTSISHANFKEIEFNSVKFENLTSKNVNTTRLLLNGLISKLNFKRFQFNYLNIENGLKSDYFEIKDCDLSGVNFNACHFKTFNELRVTASKLDQIVCTGTNWPKHITSPSANNNAFEVRETCRQLKLAMNQHHDKASELHFHALEMRAFRKDIKEKSRFWQDGVDKFSLWTGSFNDYGMNWFRPLIILFIIINFIHTLMIISETSSFPFTQAFSCGFYWSDYFTLYNPAHRQDHLIIAKEANGWTAALNFFSRIISAFFIYQIITAFRKFKR